MGVVQVHYRRGPDATASTGSKLSGFWGDCPILYDAEDQERGFGYLEDGHGVTRITSAAQVGPYAVAFQGTGDFGTSDDPGGGILMETPANPDDEVIVQYGGGIAANGSFRISDAVTEAKKLWFEVALDVNTIASGDMSFFVGLCEGLVPAADDVIKDDHTIEGARDLIGFFKKDSDASLVDVVYQKGGDTFHTLIDGGITLVADAIIRLGLLYDPSTVAARQITFFIDGIPQSTYVTSALIAASGSVAGDFPDAVMMNPTFVVKTDASTICKLILHNWGCYQLK